MFVDAIHLHYFVIYYMSNNEEILDREIHSVQRTAALFTELQKQQIVNAIRRGADLAWNCKNSLRIFVNPRRILG